jgi:hypothetical protein
MDSDALPLGLADLTFIRTKEVGTLPGPGKRQDNQSGGAGYTQDWTTPTPSATDSTV